MAAVQIDSLCLDGEQVIEGPVYCLTQKELVEVVKRIADAPDMDIDTLQYISAQLNRLAKERLDLSIAEEQKTRWRKLLDSLPFRRDNR